MYMNMYRNCVTSCTLPYCLIWYSARQQSVSASVSSLKLHSPCLKRTYIHCPCTELSAMPWMFIRIGGTAPRILILDTSCRCVFSLMPVTLLPWSCGRRPGHCTDWASLGVSLLTWIWQMTIEVLTRSIHVHYRNVYTKVVNKQMHSRDHTQKRTTHTHTIGSIPLDERSACRRDNKQHSQQTDIHAPTGFEPAIPASKRP